MAGVEQFGAAAGVVALLRRMRLLLALPYTGGQAALRFWRVQVELREHNPAAAGVQLKQVLLPVPVQPVN